MRKLHVLMQLTFTIGTALVVASQVTSKASAETFAQIGAGTK